MKKLVLLGVVILALAAAASAQPQRPISFYAGGGVSIPMSPDYFKDNWDMGPHAIIGIGYHFPAIQNFALIGKFEYHTFGLSADNLEGGDFRALLFGADAKYGFGLPAAPIKPYVLGGLGMASTEITDVDLGSQTDLYLNFGGGVDFKAGNAFGVFVQGRYVMILAEDDTWSFIPITAGFTF